MWGYFKCVEHYYNIHDKSDRVLQSPREESNLLVILILVDGTFLGHCWGLQMMRQFCTILVRCRNNSFSGGLPMDVGNEIWLTIWLGYILQSGNVPCVWNLLYSEVSSGIRFILVTIRFMQVVLIKVILHHAVGLLLVTGK